MSIVINPYHLFGLTTSSTLSDLKKSYYQLSLICHPDRGGDKDQMVTVHNSYLYLKKQLSNHNHQDLSETYQGLEQEFEDFCQQQKQELPEFSTIYDENNDFIKEFNTHFEKKHTQLEQEDLNPFQDGYSELMEISENIINDPVTPLTYSASDGEGNIKNKFQQQIIEYQEPQTLPDNYGEYLNFNVTKIKDFSHQTNNLEMTDYLKAHSCPLDLSQIKYQSLTLDDYIQQREQEDAHFKELQQKDKYKKENLTKEI